MNDLTENETCVENQKLALIKVWNFSETKEEKQAIQINSRQDWISLRLDLF